MNQPQIHNGPEMLVWLRCLQALLRQPKEAIAMPCFTMQEYILRQLIQPEVRCVELDAFPAENPALAGGAHHANAVILFGHEPACGVLRLVPGAAFLADWVFHQNLWVETPPFRAAFRVAVLVFDIV